MAFQRLLFSGVLHILLIRALADSTLFDDPKLLPEITTFHQENPASEDGLLSAQDFYDETETASGYDDGFTSPADSLFSTTSPSDVSTLAAADDLDSTFSSLYDGSDSDSSLVENPNCSSDVNQPINKREKEDMCTTTKSADPLPPDQSFERGGPSDPEFYGLPLAGYDVQLLSPDEEKNGCRRDIFELAQFLVCDSGLNEDRFSFRSRSQILVPGITLKNCDRSMCGTFVCFFFFSEEKFYVSALFNLELPGFFTDKKADKMG